jgi:hypothetical protein
MSDAVIISFPRPMASASYEVVPWEPEVAEGLRSIEEGLRVIALAIGDHEREAMFDALREKVDCWERVSREGTQ